MDQEPKPVSPPDVTPVTTAPVAVEPESPSVPTTAIRPIVIEAEELTTSTLMDSIQFLAATIVIAIFVIIFLAQAFQIPSESMEKTLLVGDYLLVDKVHYGNSGIWSGLLPYQRVTRGDIIVFKWPVRPHQHFVKRVIGVPGDRIRMARDRVLINNVPLEEKYATFKAHSHDFYRDDFPNVRYRGQQVTDDWWRDFPGFIRNGELLVPEGHYFVLGDNRDQSLDSRYWGFVPRENIVGKPFLIYLSLQTPPVQASAPPASDKIGRFGYVLWNLPGLARWDRMMRIVP